MITGVLCEAGERVWVEGMVEDLGITGYKGKVATAGKTREPVYAHTDRIYVTLDRVDGHKNVTVALFLHQFKRINEKSA